MSPAGLDARFVTVGAGLGSFAVADHLRTRGVPGADVRVLGTARRPYEHLAEMLEASQVDREGRLRSDSAARIDNLWGWPSYAMGEARRRRSPGPLWKVAVEPVFAEYYTPTAGQVFDGIDREAGRIGWDSMRVSGRVTEVRRRPGGGYTVVQASGGSGDGAVTTVDCRVVHIAVGYSDFRIAPDLAEFRRRYPGDPRAVYAYEPHEHVFDHLARHGGRVAVRGAGITASQELHRLASVRASSGTDVRVIHLVHDVSDEPQAFPEIGPARRQRRDGFTYQNFVFPRSAHGGQLARSIENLDPPTRTAVIDRLSATTTPLRREWVRTLGAGRRAGWYELRAAVADGIVAAGDGTVELAFGGRDGGSAVEAVDFLVDATGLRCSVEADPLLGEMVESGVGKVNGLGRLAVDASFAADRNPDGGAVYASGPITLGGEVAPVDSFWGLQLAALRIADDLARTGEVPPFGTARSIGAWWKWMRGAKLS